MTEGDSDRGRARAALGCSACDSIALREVAIPKGTMVAGFGKGKWVRGDEAKDADRNLLFHVTSDQDEVLFNGAMVSLRQLIMEQRKKDPEARCPRDAASLWQTCTVHPPVAPVSQ